jgi:hypothetical protein
MIFPCTCAIDAFKFELLNKKRCMLAEIIVVYHKVSQNEQHAN